MPATEPGVVRLALPDDSNAIASVQVESWRAAYAGLMPEAVLAGLSVEHRARAWRGRLEHPEVLERHLFVTDVGGTVAGFANTGPSRDEGADAATAEIYALYLAPAAWRRGHGRVLFAAAVEDLRARGFARVTLWVLDGNARGRRFYEAVGMTPDGATKVEGGGEIRLERGHRASDCESTMLAERAELLGRRHREVVRADVGDELEVSVVVLLGLAGSQRRRPGCQVSAPARRWRGSWRSLRARRPASRPSSRW